MKQNARQQTNFILQVSELTIQIKSLLERDFDYVYVEGEISGLTYHNSGHVYFNLKDDKSVIHCALFSWNIKRNPILLHNGDKIIAEGKISLYEARGTYSLIINKCAYSGIGDLKTQFERLKKELESKNYFSKNKPLPKYPKKIIILTSQTSAALQDMIKIASNRFCLCEFILIDTLTQGKEAKYSIAKNLQYADRLCADIIVLARGGGSIEDLWSFNEIEVLEAIFACNTPVVSAIGHEIDYLLSDYVADKRAPTPSAAMEMILCDKESLSMQLDDMQSHLTNTIYAIIQQKKKIVSMYQEKLTLLHPHKKIMILKQQINSNLLSLYNAITSLLAYKKQILRQYYEHIELLKPTRKITQSHQTLESLYHNATFHFQIFLREKRKILESANTAVVSQYNMILRKKRSMLPDTLHKSMLYFLQQKKIMLHNLTQILENSNPQRHIKHGYVQILKDNKAIQIADLKSKDTVELIDASGSVMADIL